VERFGGISSVREYVARRRREGRRIVLVPTMGAFHAGHGACIEVGRRVEGGALVVSIFLNPEQFGPEEDLDEYPRTLDADVERCREWGVDAVFEPQAADMYPSPQLAWVTVETLTAPLCGRSRPDHFRGVATVVAKLFNIVRPDVAVFGQKDAQQALVIREMVRQLNMPVELRLAAISREADGLARSSRNNYLDEGERAKAASIPRALSQARRSIESGERNPAAVAAGIARDLRRAGGVDELEYAEVLDAGDLSALDEIRGKAILAVAARVGATRLIDNVVLNVGDDGAVSEELLF
jgi:pantoate--beta-alanine ligase